MASDGDLLLKLAAATAVADVGVTLKNYVFETLKDREKEQQEE